MTIRGHVWNRGTAPKPAVILSHGFLANGGKMMFFKFDPTNIPDLLGRFPMKPGGIYARCVIDMNYFNEIEGYKGRTLYLHEKADTGR